VKVFESFHWIMAMGGLVRPSFYTLNFTRPTLTRADPADNLILIKSDT